MVNNVDVQVVHCVMYPRLEYDLPILSFDMVGKDERVSLVCIDPCPVAMDRSLPPVYVSVVRYALAPLPLRLCFSIAWTDCQPCDACGLGASLSVIKSLPMQGCKHGLAWQACAISS